MHAARSIYEPQIPEQTISVWSEPQRHPITDASDLDGELVIVVPDLRINKFRSPLIYLSRKQHFSESLLYKDSTDESFELYPAPVCLPST